MRGLMLCLLVVCSTTSFAAKNKKAKPAKVSPKESYEISRSEINQLLKQKIISKSQHKKLLEFTKN
jgi:hypothetical protein